jgi:KTSC domain
VPFAETPVSSSHIASVAHDDNGTLTVSFRDGSVYNYHGVPDDEAQALVEAASVGKYLHNNIVGRYRHERIR